MAIWNFLKDGASVGAPFDDGFGVLPGEDGFSRDAAVKQAATFGDGVIPDYAGTPNSYGDTNGLDTSNNN